MGNLNISNRYATALLSLATDKNAIESIYGDFQLVYNTIKSSNDLKVMLGSPVIKNEKKIGMLSEIFSGRVGQDSLDFILFIAKKNREDLLFNIVERFLELIDDYHGVVPAEVKSPVELSDKQKDRLRAKLEEYTGKKVRLSFALDDTLLGGFIVRMKDKVIDASLKHQLEKLKDELLKGGVSYN